MYGEGRGQVVVDISVELDVSPSWGAWRNVSALSAMKWSLKTVFF